MGRILIPANFTAVAPTSAYPINLTRAEEQRKSGKFSPTLVVVVSVIIVSFFVVGFASGYLRRWLWGHELAEETRHSELMRRRRRQLRMNASTWCPSAPRGLDPDLIAAMPLVRFKDLEAGDDEKYFDCPVCLALFEGPDTLKLLPHCAHAFHSDCIDQWFRSHSTCPLCRVSMTSRPPPPRIPPDFDIADSADAVPEPVAMASAEPEANPRFDVHVSCSNGFGPPAKFVPGIRGDTAPARAATLASIRRSRSVGTDLIQHGYVVDSEGTQHHRNSQVHVIALDGVSSRTVVCSWCARRSFSNLRQLAPV